LVFHDSAIKGLIDELFSERYEISIIFI